MTLVCSSMDSIPEEVWNLYQQSFSEGEKIPRKNLERALGNGALLDMFTDGRFIGFIFGFRDGDRIFFIYFATVPEVRGKGYGGRMLEMFRAAHKGTRSFLVTEPPDPDAEDNGIRERRKAFYRRNGCRETGVRLLSDDLWFDSMFVDGSLTEQEMVDTVRLYEDIHNGRL